jgi:hypothetical protein
MSSAHLDPFEPILFQALEKIGEPYRQAQKGIRRAAPTQTRPTRLNFLFEPFRQLDLDMHLIELLGCDL